MTEDEKQMFKSSDFEANMFRTPVTRTRVGPDGKKITYSGYVEKGIKITVKRANQNTEEVKQDNTDDNPPAAGAAAASTDQVKE